MFELNMHATGVIYKQHFSHRPFMDWIERAAATNKHDLSSLRMIFFYLCRYVIFAYSCKVVNHNSITFNRTIRLHG